MTHTDEVVESILVDFETKFSYGGFGGLLPQQRDGGVNLMREVKHFIRGALATAQAAKVESALRDFAEFAHTRYLGTDGKEYAYSQEVVYIVDDYLASHYPTPAEVTSERK